MPANVQNAISEKLLFGTTPGAPPPKLFHKKIV